MRFQGKIREWDDPRGFGFIGPLEGGERVFVHISAFPVGSRRPDAGEFVNYELELDERGRPRARNVTYIIERSTRGAAKRTPRAARIVAGAIATTFLVGVAAAALEEALPWWIPGFYVAASITAYMTYARDKTAAEKCAWRIPEANLLILGVVGGWPGALFAQHNLRHKNRKISFQLLFWFTVALNFGLLVWLRTP